MSGDSPVVRRGYWSATTYALSLAVVVTVVGFTVPGALSDAMNMDEVASARVLSEPSLAGALERVRETESTPPGWYVLARSVSEVDRVLLNRSLFFEIEALRLLSVAFVALASLLTGLWALSLLGSRVLGVLAGLLAGLGSVPAGYAEQLRAYALLMLLSVVFGRLLVCVADQAGSWPLCGLALCAWLGMMTHYFFFLLLAAGGAWLWMVRPVAPGRLRATLALTVATLGFLPWVSSFLHQVGHGTYRWIGAFDAGRLALLPGGLFFGHNGLLFGLARIAVTGAVLIGAFVIWKKRHGSAIVALAFLPVLGVGILWALGEPVFTMRNMLPVAPFMAILAVSSLSALPSRLGLVAGVVGLTAVIAAAVFADASLGRVEYDRIARALVDVGWTAAEPVAVEVGESGRRTGLSLISPVSWYLPGRPVHVRAPPRHDCQARFVLAHVPDVGSWLAAHRRDLVAVRDLASYNHIVRGSRDGRIVVARLRAPATHPGAVFAVQGRPDVCSSALRLD